MIALQINNWNEERKDRDREAIIIAELNKDFISNAEQLDFISSGHENSLRSTNWLIDHFPYDESMKDSLTYHIAQIHSAYTFDPAQSSVQALINTSSFDLISNEELRRKLVIWSDLFRDYSEEEYVARDVFIKFLIPYMHTYSEMDFMLDTNSEPIQDISPFQTSEFRNIIISRRVTLDLNIVNSPEQELQRLKQVIQDIIALTEVED